MTAPLLRLIVVNKSLGPTAQIAVARGIAEAVARGGRFRREAKRLGCALRKLKHSPPQPLGTPAGVPGGKGSD